MSDYIKLFREIYLDKFPKQKKFIYKEFEKLDKFKMKYEDDRKFVTDRMHLRLSTADDDSDLNKEFDLQWNKDKEYLEHIRTQWADKEFFFIRDFREKLEKRELFNQYD
jgi:hypothetical protein